MGKVSQMDGGAQSRRGARPAPRFQRAWPGRVDLIWGQGVAVWVLITMLAGLGATPSAEGYAEAQARYPDLPPGEGRRLVEELNCRGCHPIPDLPEPRKVAPVLSYAGSKFRRDWLVDFLKTPHTLRPAGYLLGWQSRMPNFRLSEEEVQAMVDYLMTLTYPGLPQGAVKEEKALSPLEKFQAGKLFEKTHGCIACHQVKNRRGEVVGGRSGPNLSEAGKRLQGDFIYRFIRAPRAFEPQGKMVVFGDFLSDKEARALAAYLSTLKGDR